jgi:hypothetical protein
MGKRAARNRHRYALSLRLLLAGTLVGAVLILIAGLSAPFPRSYVSWSGEVLADLLSGLNTVPSPIAPIAWSGVGPLTIQDLPLHHGSRLELKLRAERGQVPVRIVIDGRSVARLEVRPVWRSYRLWLEGDGSTLLMEQTSTNGIPIHISRIKITNVVGFADGLLNAWIVRRGLPYRPAIHDASWGLLLGVLGVACVLLLLPESAGRAASLGYRRCAAGVAAVAVVLAVGRLVAAALGFRLIFTSGTAVAVLLLPCAAFGGWSLVRRVRVPRVSVAATWRRVRTPVVVGVVVALWAAALLVLVAGRYGGDIRGVARFSWKFHLAPAVEDAPFSRGGYDGEFYAVLASDPLLRHTSTFRGLDNPAYRATRVLVPLLAWASVGGSARLGPFAYVVWCWALGLAGPVIVLLWLGAFRWRFMLFVLLATNAGLVVSLVRATPDAAALALMLAALLLADRSRWPAATAAGGTLSVLARETSVLAVPGLVWPELKAGWWKRAIGMALAPAAALGSWRLYVRAVTHRGVGSAWGNFGIPCGWLPEKVRRMWAAGWAHGKVEWLGVAWALLLIGVAASYLVRRKKATPALVTFLLFAALATALNMRVYTEVNAYARVLIALPFLAAVLVAEESLRWRRGLLIAGVVLASAQGALLLRGEVGRAWHMWQLHGGVHLRQTRLAGLAISGVRPEPGRRWEIPVGVKARLTSVTGTRYVTLSVLDGHAAVRRGGHRLLSLGPDGMATLQLPRGGAYLELVPEGRGTVEMAPVTTSSSPPGIPGGAVLVPVVAGTGGVEGSRWVTSLALTSRAARPRRVTLMFLPRRADGRGRMWAELTLDPGRGLELDDLVPALFGVHSAGALLVASAGPGLSVRCRIGHRMGVAVSWAGIPVVLPADRERTAGARWKIEVPLGHGHKRASVILVNATSRPTTARLRAATERGVLADAAIRLGVWEVRQLETALGDGAGRLRVTVSGEGGGTPVGVLSVIDETTGRVELFCSSGSQPAERAP